MKRAALIVVASLASGISASAEKVAVLEFSGTDVADAAMERFEQAFVAGLEGAGFEVVAREQLWNSLRATEFVDGCVFGPCMKVLYEATGMETAVVGKVQLIGSSYTFVASLVDAESGRLRAQVTRSCPACSVDDAELNASQLGSEFLLTELEGDVPPASGGAVKGLKTSGWLFTGGGVLFGGIGAVLLSQDKDIGWAGIGGGAGLLLGGAAMFVHSSRF